jgi:energy-coupling factor transporter ATP-binding protein EcfA2
MATLSGVCTTNCGGETRKTGLENSISAGYKIINDANLQNLSQELGCKLGSTSDVLQKNLATAMITRVEPLINRRSIIMVFRVGPKSEIWNSRFDRLAEIEDDLLKFFKEEGSDENSLENDAIAQLSFDNDYLKPFNQVPFMIMLIALFKIWVVPTMTILTPIIAWIVPYILLRFVYALPINQQEYVRILQGMWAGDMAIPNVNIPAPDMWTPRSIFQFILFGFSFAQSMIQPIQNAMHLYKTDTVLVGLGTRLLELRQIIEEFRAETKDMPITLTNLLDDLDPADPRRAFMLIKEQPGRIHTAFRDLAQLEVLWRISQAKAFNPVMFKPDSFSLEDMVDVSLKDGVASSLSLSEKSQRHAVITGPNGGGKSSFLRATLQCTLLAHTYGMAPAKKAIMPRFLWIASGLQLRDTPGVYSMFETEVKFAADCARSARRGPGPGLVLFDELFHSTNPPDGARSAEVFLRQLWAPESSAYSVVSTHVFPLVDKKPENVQAICCPGTEAPDGSIIYSYKAEPGICRVSSVRTVWDNFGLLKLRGRGAQGKVSR